LPTVTEFKQLGNRIAGEEPTTYSTGYDEWSSNAGELVKGSWWEETQTEGAPGDYDFSNRNIFGFGAVPSGFFYENENFDPDDDEYCFLDWTGSTSFWTAQEFSQSNGCTFEIPFSDESWISIYNRRKNRGYSVRCVRDE